MPISAYKQKVNRCNYIHLLLVIFLLASNQSSGQIEGDSCKTLQDQFMKTIATNIDEAILVAYDQIKEGKTKGISYCRIIGYSNLVTSYVLKVEKDSIHRYLPKVLDDEFIDSHPNVSQRTLVTMGAYYVNNAMPDSAIHLLKNRIEKDEWLPRYYVNACMKTSLAYANKFENQEAIHYLKLADSVAIKNDLESGTKGELYASFALAYNKAMRYPESMEYFQKCLEEYRSINFTRNFTYYFNNLANAAINIDSFELAKNYLDSAQVYVEYLPSFQGAIHWTRALLNQKQNNHEESIAANLKVIDYYKADGTGNSSLYIYNAVKDILLSKLHLGHTDGYSNLINQIDQETAKNFSLRDSFHFSSYKLIEKTSKVDKSLAKEQVEKMLLAVDYISSVRDSSLSENLEKYQSQKKGDSIRILSLENKEKELIIDKRNNLIGGGSIVIFLLSILAFFYRKYLKAQQSLNELTLREKELLKEKQIKLELENADLVFQKSELQKINTDLQKSLAENINEAKQQRTILEIKTKSKTHLVEGDQLLYINAEDAGSRYYLIDGTSLWDDQTLKFWEANLDVKKFPRIHKSYLVNKEHIRWINYNKLSLRDGTEVPIGRAYKDNLI